MRHHVFEGGRPALITGIAWDHRRCWGPLDASIAPYRQLTGEDVRWDRRSLYSFGEGDLGSYAEKYELVIYDHPFVGDISRRGWMLDLTAYLSVEQRAHFERDEVGASWRSYAYDGGIWGLPLDTAAQTAAWRKDLLDRHGCDVPKTLEEVRRLAESGAPKGIAVGWPSVPTDLMCTLVTIAASMGCNPGHAPGDFLDPVDADEVVGELKALARLVHPKSREWNPIRCLDHMAANDDVAYVPYLFNYVNYSSGSPARKVTFGAAPAVKDGYPPHTLLGGAGIGVSARARDPKAALDYALWLCSPQYQAGDYVKFGGQPGSRSAWTSDACNALTGEFFASTLPVLDSAYLRPTHPGFVPFFHDATLKLAGVVYEGAPLRPFVDWLNASYDRIRPAKAAAE
jgi:multiple sugar transport system substrate-binding protein